MLTNEIKILIIEDDEDVRRGIATFFCDSGYEVLEADNGEEGMKRFQSEQPDIIFTELRMPIMGGLEVIKAVKELNPDIPIIVISGTGAVKDAVEALRFGAWDYVEKPVTDLEALEHMASKALENKLLRNQVAGLKQKLLSGEIRNPEVFDPIITRSPAMFSIFQYIEVVAPTAQPVLINGETGTGKELFANAIHAASGRSGKFVALNIAGLDDQMFSDTLFGHTKGAFTGAEKSREGLIAQASGGTLFLDEVGDLQETTQIKLLRLLQEGEYFPLGSDHPRKSDARIVLATHRNLADMVANGKFRQDLYYRLFAHQVSLPPLREREDDLVLLLDHYLLEAAESLGKKKPTVPQELASYLKTYKFPGNVRELRAMVYDAVTRHVHGVLSMDAFIKCMGKTTEMLPKAEISHSEIILRHPGGERMPTLDEAEDVLLEQAMRLANGNQGLAAGYLGLNRTTLNKKLQKRKENEELPPPYSL